MLARIRESEELPETRTANSLTGLFLPEFNEALSDYWKTLRQRLFNLRNNLTIDGMPLSLPLFADRADPSQLLSSMVLNAQESSHLPVSTLTLWRFPVMLERARNTVAQLTQFGASLLSLAEHQDADEINTLLMQQGMGSSPRVFVFRSGWWMKWPPTGKLSWKPGAAYRSGWPRTSISGTKIFPGLSRM